MCVCVCFRGAALMSHAAFARELIQRLMQLIAKPLAAVTAVAVAAVAVAAAAAFTAAAFRRGEMPRLLLLPVVEFAPHVEFYAQEALTARVTKAAHINTNNTNGGGGGRGGGGRGGGGRGRASANDESSHLQAQPRGAAAKHPTPLSIPTHTPASDHLLGDTTNSKQRR